MLTLGVAGAAGAFAFANDSPSQSVAAQSVSPLPTAYTYDLSWRPRSRLLTGSASLTVKNSGTAELRSIWLRMRANDGVRNARVDRLNGARVGSERAGGSMLRLDFSVPVPAGDSGTVGFRYRLTLPLDDSSLGRDLGVDLFGDALPVVAVAGPRGLRIGPEPLYGEGSFNPVAQWNVKLRVPRGLRAVLPGREIVSHTTKGNTHQSVVSVRDYAFAVGRLTTRSQLVDGVRVRVAGSPAARGMLSSALRRGVYAFRQMQSWLGGYDLPDLDIVVGALDFGGSEYPGIVFSTPDLATISHEVAHQWFYGLVGNDQYNDPWLDESLTAFYEERFQHVYRCNLADPLDSARRGLKTSMRYWDRHPSEYEATIYRGGACALRRLERDIGGPAFDAAMRNYVAENAGDLATTEDFLGAVQRAAPGYDLAAWERRVGLS